MRDFYEMVHAFESLEGSRGERDLLSLAGLTVDNAGTNGTILWLRDYEKQFDFVAGGAQDDWFSDEVGWCCFSAIKQSFCPRISQKEREKRT